jgi:hypothetical protein
MRPPDELIIVQRHQHALYKTLRQATRGTAELLFDRRQRERRRGGVYAGVERRHAHRRRVLSVEERARWTELRHLIVPRLAARE